MRIPGPRTIKEAIEQLRQVRAGGGPAKIRLERIDRPRGVIFPTSQVALSIEARSGKTVRLAPDLPVPWPYAWGYRLARLVHLPIVKDVEPGDVRFSLPVPGFLGRRLGSDG